MGEVCAIGCDGIVDTACEGVRGLEDQAVHAYDVVATVGLCQVMMAMLCSSRAVSCQPIPSKTQQGCTQESCKKARGYFAQQTLLTASKRIARHRLQLVHFSRHSFQQSCRQQQLRTRTSLFTRFSPASKPARSYH